MFTDRMVNVLLVVVFVGGLFAGDARAGAPHFEGFEDPGFTPGGDNWNNYNGGDIQRVTSGTGGITSKTGAAHGIITNLSENDDVFGDPSLGALSPYTRFDGYSSTFGGGYRASLDVYLDTGWSNEQGFDYSVAANGSDGNHQRDFIWHVGVVDGNLLVNASNNSDYSFNAFKLENENSGTNFTISASDWYTLEHVFRDDGGLLAVDMNLRDSNGDLLYSVTRGPAAADTIPAEVGGNRYGWFTYNNIDGLAIDNTSLVAIPAPAAWPAGLALIGAAMTRRRRRH